MPLYVWVNKTTGETREVHASIKDADVPPPGEGWERVIQPPSRILKGPNWGKGKGFYNSEE